MVIGRRCKLDPTGNHRTKNDYVDYYAEIIKPDGIGEATYRIKAEAVPSGGIDSEPESGLFNAKGVVTTSNSQRLTEASTSYYNSASDRQFIFEVVSAGDTNPGVSGSRPKVDIYEINLNDDINEKRLIQSNVELVSGMYVDVGHGLKLEVDSSIGQFVQTDNGVKTCTNSAFQLSGISSDRIHTTVDHDYSYQPRIQSWKGTTATEFTFEVIQGGHSLSQANRGFADEKSAHVKVTAHKLDSGETTNTTISNLNPLWYTTNYHTFEGLTFYFPPEGEHGQIVSAPPPTPNFMSDYSYSYYSRTHSNYKFLNETDRQYEMTILEDRVFSNYSNVPVNIDVYDLEPGGLRTLVQSYQDELISGRYMYFGTNDANDQGIDGIAIQFGAAIYTNRYGALPNSDGSIVLSNSAYITPEDNIVFLEITETGTLGGDAKFKYYYQADPSTIIDSGSLSSSQVLADGIKYTASLPNTGGQATIIQDSGADTNFELVDTGFIGERNSNFQITISDIDPNTGLADPTNLFAYYSWHEEGAASPEATQSAQVQIGQALDIGHNVSVRLIILRVHKWT